MANSVNESVTDEYKEAAYKFAIHKVLSIYEKSELTINLNDFSKIFNEFDLQRHKTIGVPICNQTRIKPFCIWNIRKTNEQKKHHRLDVNIYEGSVKALLSETGKHQSRMGFRIY